MLCQVFCSLFSFPCSFSMEFVVVSDKMIIEQKENHKPKTGCRKKRKDATKAISAANRYED